MRSMRCVHIAAKVPQTRAAAIGKEHNEYAHTSLLYKDAQMNEAATHHELHQNLAGNCNIIHIGSGPSSRAYTGPVRATALLSPTFRLMPRSARQ